jgi:alkylation response protein AidB-like acyl-CoA dehydrogenase
VQLQRRIFEPEHEQFREVVARFAQSEIAPHHLDWEREGIVPREIWLRMGELGLLCTDVPEEYGGGGMPDFRYNLVITEELMRVGASGLGTVLHNDTIVPYFLKYASDEQKRRFLPGMARGELITAIAMTEPGAGSDLAGVRTTAVKQPDGSYLLNGTKTFITNGIHSDVIIVVAKTDPSAKHAGISLLIVERDMPGFSRGRKLEKVGMHAQDTAELIFEDVVVPAHNLLGEEGSGFRQLMEALPQERLSIAVSAMAGAVAAFDLTLTYVKEREAFGKPIGSFQNSRFMMAEMATRIQAGQAFADQCVELLNEGRLTAEHAAMAKWFLTDLQGDVLDACVQLHGGYGYMREYEVARWWADARVQRIYGGTNEIMKEIIGRSLGL